MDFLKKEFPKKRMAVNNMKLLKQNISLIVVLAILNLSPIVLADDDVYVPPKVYTYNFNEINNVETNVTSITTALMGDTFDPATGTISFTHTDLTLPGNFALDVMAQRTLTDPDNWYKATLEFGNWSLDLPHIRSSYITNYPGNNFSQSGNGSYWARNAACSAPLNSNPSFFGNVGSSTYQLLKTDYYNGDFVSIPGKGSSKIIENNGQKTTNQFWKIACQNINGVDSFKITTTDGTIYLFSHLFVKPSLKHVYMGAANEPCSWEGCQFPPLDHEVTIFGHAKKSQLTRMQKLDSFMMVTKITDRHGNTVDFTYNTSGRIANIQTSDERLITFPGSGSLITSMNANGRTWQYNYIPETSKEVAKLSSVTLPDGKSWHFDYLGDNYPFNLQTQFWNKETIGQHSQQIPSSPTQCYGGVSGHFVTMTHPEGAEGEFRIAERCLGQADVPKIETFNRYGQGNLYQHYEIPIFSLAWALDDKTLRLADGTEYHWDYHYSDNPGYFHGDPTTSSHSSLTPMSFSLAPIIPGVSNTKDINATYMVNPDGRTDVTYFSRAYGEENSTQIHSAVFAANGTIWQKSSYTYADGILQGTSLNWTMIYGDVNGQRHPWLKNMNTGPYANTTQFRTSFGDDRKQLNKITEKTVYGETGGTSIYTTDNRIFNQYGIPTSISQLSDTASRYIFLGYDHDATRWILNQPTTTKVNNVDSSNVGVMKEVTYYSKSHSLYPFMPYQEKWFNQTKKTHVSYHKGNLSRVEYNEPLAFGSGNRYLIFADYYRGIPTTLTVPDRHSTDTFSAYRDVDYFGAVTSVTDYNGYTTGYKYDAVGRILSVDMPGTDWLDSLFTWSYDGGANSDQPVRTVERCILNSAKDACTDIPELTTTSTFDSLLRAKLIHTTDGATDIYVNNTYNVNNKLTFESYPSTFSTETNGTHYQYDTLGQLKETSTTWGGTSYNHYLAGNKLRVTDPENNVTTTTYLAYGNPAYDQATKIESPEQVMTDIAVNIFGNIESIRQYSTKDYTVDQTEYHAYDSQQQLCQIKRNDVGTTVYKRNTLGEILWMAEGQTAGSNTSCNVSASTGTKVEYKYDNLGTLYETTYEDGTPTRYYSYDNNGNVKSVAASGYSQNYNYNSANLLEDETLTITGRSGSLTLEYGYDKIGSLSSLQYPDTTTAVNFAPNAFGQATQAIRTNADTSTDTFVKGGINQATYHPNGVIDSFTYGNGIEHKTMLNLRNMPEQITDKKGSSDRVNLTYDYDNNSNIISISNTQDGGLYSLSNLSYDGLDRLTSTTGSYGIGNSSISYDGLGNIRTYSNTSSYDPHDLTYSYSTGNRLTAVSGDGSTGYNFNRSDSYDPRGNVTHNGKRGFNYNLANQMLSSGNSSFVYDGNNRRIKSVKDNGKVEYSMYSQSGKLLYRETDQGGINYIFLGKKLVAKEGTGVVSQGDSRMNYKPFGDSIEEPKDDVGYTGHKFDKDLGLSYMQARYYDPVIGRFMSNDPVGFRDVHSFNRYAYANNNPYKYVDPDGESPRDKMSGARAAKMGAGLAYLMGWVDLETARAIGDSVDGKAKKRSKAKRRASRAAQRKKVNPRVATSQSGENMQGNAHGTPNLRGQVKTGMDGKTKVGIQDGTMDRNNDQNHKPAVDVGNMKTGEQPGRNGQPRIQNMNKVKEVIQDEKKKKK